MALATTVLLISLVCIAVHYILKYRDSQRYYKTVNNLPGPRAYPFIGSTYYFFRKNLDESENSSQNKSVLYKLIEPVIGNGLFLVHASEWKTYRRVIAPSFNKNMLQSYCDIFVKESLALADKLKKTGLSEEEVDYYHDLLECTMNIACDKKKVKKIFISRARNIFLYPDFIFNHTTLGYEQQRCVKVFESFVNEIIEQNISNTNTRNTVFGNLTKAFQEKQLTRQNIVDNIRIMFAAGSDTTAMTINFVLFVFANIPEVQERAYEEMRQIYGYYTDNPRSAQIKYEDMDRMEYLERVIKETMRIFPTIPLVGRQISTELQLGETTLPKNTDVYMSIINVHRNDKIWPNPLKFDPDRFLPEIAEKRTPYCYIPFSTGPRNCIGTQYAIISMKIILATLIRLFVFKVNKNIELDKVQITTDIMLNPVKPLKIIIKPRNKREVCGT